MILYHFSNGKYNKLIPKIETGKHLDKKIDKNKGIILLTTNPSTLYDHDTGDNFFKYRYTVNVDRNDQLLYPDNKFNKIMKRFDEKFKPKCGVFSWFYYTGSLNYIFVSQWDKKLCRFS